MSLRTERFYIDAVRTTPPAAHVLWTLVFLMLAVTIDAQEPSVEELRSLGRTALVEMAAREAGESGRFESFDPASFDRATALTDGELLWVTFDIHSATALPF